MKKISLKDFERDHWKEFFIFMQTVTCIFLRTASQQLDFISANKKIMVFYTPPNTFLSHEAMPSTFVILPPRPMAAAFRRAVLATAVPIINWKRVHPLYRTVYNFVYEKKSENQGGRGWRYKRVTVCSHGVLPGDCMDSFNSMGLGSFNSMRLDSFDSMGLDSIYGNWDWTLSTVWDWTPSAVRDWT